MKDPTLRNSLFNYTLQFKTVGLTLLEKDFNLAEEKDSKSHIRRTLVLVLNNLKNRPPKLIIK